MDDFARADDGASSEENQNWQCSKGHGSQEPRIDKLGKCIRVRRDWSGDRKETKGRQESDPGGRSLGHPASIQVIRKYVARLSH